jgi:hypothetical protein
MRWWRLLSAPLALMLVVVGGCAVGGGREAPTKSTAAVVMPPATTMATARVGGPLVGVISSDNLATELARLDPRTLRPLPGGRLKLAGSWPMLAVAPDRSTAILGSEAGDLAVVDLVHLRRLGDVKTDLPGAAILGWGWVGRSRLLLIDTSQQAATQVLAVDVNARRVVRRQHFNGVVQGYARLPRGLALLVTPANAIGRARLLVSDADAGLRTVTLAEINAGFRQFDDSDGSEPRMEQALPGIAADPTGRRVYIVPRQRTGGRGRAGQPAGYLPSARAAGVAVAAAEALVGAAGRGEDPFRPFAQRALARRWPTRRDRL